MGKGRRRKEGGGSGRVGGGGRFEEKSTVTLVEATKAFQLWERLNYTRTHFEMISDLHLPLLLYSLDVYVVDLAREDIGAKS